MLHALWLCCRCMLRRPGNRSDRQQCCTRWPSLPLRGSWLMRGLPGMCSPPMHANPTAMHAPCTRRMLWTCCIIALWEGYTRVPQALLRPILCLLIVLPVHAPAAGCCSGSASLTWNASSAQRAAHRSGSRPCAAARTRFGARWRRPWPCSVRWTGEKACIMVNPAGSVMGLMQQGAAHQCKVSVVIKHTPRCCKSECTGTGSHAGGCILFNDNQAFLPGCRVAKENVTLRRQVAQPQTGGHGDVMCEQAAVEEGRRVHTPDWAEENLDGKAASTESAAAAARLPAANTHVHAAMTGWHAKGDRTPAPTSVLRTGVATAC